MTPNRITAIGVAALGVILAIAGIAASSGAPEAVAIAAGAGLIAVPAREWLIGWREYERRQGEGDQPVSFEDLREQALRLTDPDAAEKVASLLPSRFAELPGQVGALAAAVDALHGTTFGTPIEDEDEDHDLHALAAAEPGPDEPVKDDPADLPPEERGTP